RSDTTATVTRGGVKCYSDFRAIFIANLSRTLVDLRAGRRINWRPDRILGYKPTRLGREIQRIGHWLRCQVSGPEASTWYVVIPHHCVRLTVPVPAPDHRSADLGGQCGIWSR